MPQAAQHTREEQLRRIEDVRRRAAEAQQREARELAGVISEIQALRVQADEVASKLHEKSQLLRKLTRRSSDEGASSILVFANAHIRLAGALNQGVRRTASMDRVLNRAEADRQEAKRREEERQRRREEAEQAKLVEQLQEPTQDAFTELYGDLLDDELEEVTRA